MSELEDELESSNQFQRVIPAAAVSPVLAVFFLSVSLDYLNLVGGPQAVAKLACTLRPLAVVSAPVFSTHLLQFAAESCLLQPHEPAISIIFFMAKLAMGILVIPVLWGYVVLRPQRFWELRDFYYQRYRKPGGYVQELKRFGESTFVILFVIFYFVVESTFASVAEFDTWITHKILVEDLLVLFSPIAIVQASLTAVVLVAFALSHRKSRAQGD
jgi:hypothetical protein